ncbi:MAG: AAA family ATPase [Chloroflexi bacterium]|nr:AAA family ATPase [Chloroflexota bacterium]
MPEGTPVNRYQQVISALEHPEAYPERPLEIQHIQTHISHLFLTPDRVYKVKKPVDFGFLNFTTFEQRRHFCQQELVLNRRVSPDVYLDVVEVRRAPDGTIAVGGDGEVVEHAVMMRRLPTERSLDRLLANNQVTEEMVRSLARVTGGFHQQAATSPEIQRYGTPEAVAGPVGENFQQTQSYVGRTFSPLKYQRLQEYSTAFLKSHRDLLARRATGGRVRDCHGDLHCAQVFVTDEGVRIIDCIEFTERFRYSDVASDMAFMAMDLDQFGRHDLSRVFVDTWAEVTGDREALQLLDFYKVYRAYVRGKVESFRLDDPHIPQAEKDAATLRARSYFALAYFYTQKPAPPRLIICGGMVGTGKSTIARYVAGDGGLAVLSSDAVRKRLAAVPLTERHFDAPGTGLYSPEATQRTYGELLRLARQYLEEGHSVVLDATFGRREQRQQAAALAQELGAVFWAVEPVASEGDIRERLERRVQRGGSVSDGRWEIYVHEKTTFEPLEEVPQERHVVVDTSAGTVSDSVRYALQRLGIEQT